VLHVAHEHDKSTMLHWTVTEAVWHCARREKTRLQALLNVFQMGAFIVGLNKRRQQIANCTVGDVCIAPHRWSLKLLTMQLTTSTSTIVVVQSNDQLRKL